MTVMQKAFENAGLHPRDAEMNVAIAKYVNSGGTLNELRALIDAAERMPGMDQVVRAQKSQCVDVQTRQPSGNVRGQSSSVGQDHGSHASPSSFNRGGEDQQADAQKSQGTPVLPVREPVEDGEARSRMPKGQDTFALPSSSNRGWRDHSGAAVKGQPEHVSPVREPSESVRRADVAIAKMMAVTVLDTLKIDGRAIGDWTVGEARKLGPQKTREGFILIEATRKVANARSDQFIRNVLKVDELQAIMQKAAEIADAV